MEKQTNEIYERYLKESEYNDGLYFSKPIIFRVSIFQNFWTILFKNDLTYLQIVQYRTASLT